MKDLTGKERGILLSISQHIKKLFSSLKWKVHDHQPHDHMSLLDPMNARYMQKWQQKSLLKCVPTFLIHHCDINSKEAQSMQ